MLMVREDSPTANQGKINFLQLGRFGKFSEQYFRIGFQKKFDFISFNISLLKEHLSPVLAIAMDPSYIFKSGKHTEGVGCFWSGCASKAKWGLELCGFAVVDIHANTAYHLKAFQSPSLVELDKKNNNLLAHYGNLIKENSKFWIYLSKYLLADAYFSKKPFLDSVLASGMQLISRLRDDADVRYIYQGTQKIGKGRPKLYAGKVDIKNPDTEYFIIEETTDRYKVYSALVYSKAFKQKIRLALVVFNDAKKTRKMYFSTDIELNASQVFMYYRSRFQTVGEQSDALSTSTGGH
jgi:hypothetical protein